ncbi:cytochrome b [Neorhizobium alkalisoli]|uniref:Cytochrome b561 n=1 Tax=Neorhizobium alkalisoli TaxID=528178 RepID=A0A561R7M6_9HYPH|nr:cytochrome b/b6 domain-containing protein [Neorhizobium alkalisoli]TWF58623.1 cytochrome b561 [Neorhizobium alkalisoli]
MTAIGQETIRTAQGARYDGLTIAFHWITAIVVIFQFASAQIWPLLERGTPARTGVIQSHLTLGVLLSAVILLRLVWRICFGRRHPVRLPLGQRLVANVVHGLLYALLITQVALGYLLGWSSGKPIAVFGVPSISPLYVIAGENRHMIGELHDTVAWIIIGLAVAHAAAALFHHHVLRDGVLRSMTGLAPKRVGHDGRP